METETKAMETAETKTRRSRTKTRTKTSPMGAEDPVGAGSVAVAPESGVGYGVSATPVADPASGSSPSSEAYGLPLTDEEIAAWTDLVRRGEEIRAADPRQKARDARADANRAEFVQKKRWANPKSAWANPKRVWTERSAHAKGDGGVPSVGVVRWVLARASGLTPKEADARSGVRWMDVYRAHYRSNELRRAMDAMYESNRMRIRQAAYGTIAGACEGVETDNVNARTAMWAAERLDRAAFADPRAMSSVAAAASAGGGGIVINLLSVDDRAAQVRKALGNAADAKDAVAEAEYAEP